MSIDLEKGSDQSPCSPCVTAAVDWWTNAVYPKSEDKKKGILKQKQAFRDTLTKGIEAGLAKFSSVTLRSSYRPEGILLEAAHAGNVCNCAFPEMVRMTIDKTHVEVAEIIWEGE